MHARLKISTRIRLAILLGAALAVVASVVGVLGMRLIRGSTLSLAASTQVNLEKQSSELDRKIHLSSLALEVANAKSLEQLDRVASEAAQTLTLSGSAFTVADDRASQLTELEVQIRGLCAIRRSQLLQQAQLARINFEVGTNLQAITSLVTNLVSQLQRSANQKTAESLDALAAGGREEKATTDSGLKELMAKMDATIRSVTAVLEARAGTYELNVL